MSYEEINKANRNYMKGTIREGPVMEWNDSSLMDTLMGRMPKLRVTNKDDQVRTEIHKLQSILETYRYTETNCDDFLKEISAIINRIWDVEPYWYGFTIDEISYFLAMQRFCVISGFGGMGKSYFIYRLEEQLEESSIPHLCIYGKYQKELNSIDFSEIHSAANNGVFLLIVDAINELDHSIQTELIKKIQPLLSCKGLRVIITYRTHRLSGDIVALLNSLATYQYTFSGVSYESALEVILRKPVLNVYKYESILYSNNAFYLQMLCKVLSKPVVKDEEINSFSILTHILEAYIKDTLGKECWVYTKMIAKWMYDNRRRDIPRTELLTIIKKPDNYILLMKQYGLFNEVEFHNELNYSFSIESLSDYMLARYFVQEISGKTESEQLEIIKQRRSEFFGMDEVFIVSLFDLSNDYDLIKRLLKSSGLISSFDFEALLHINFNLSDIKPFQLAFPINDTANPLLMLGGYSEKPFNCVNYLNDYYLTASYRQKKELSSLLSGQIISGRLTDRLKNMIYFVSVVKTDITDEMLWFALWCTASANQKTRCYAIKLLYEIVLKKPQYAESIALYHVCTEKPWVCKEIPSIKKNKDWFDPTELMFPPAQIVSDLNLHYELTTMSWNTDAGDIVIRCDNNKKSYIRSEISSGIFMRKDYYDLYVASKPIHFFCFTEKMIKERGFTDEASLHLEFSQGKLTRQFFNADEQKIEQETPNQLCQTCPYGFVSTGDEKDVDIDEYFDILKQLGYSRTSDVE